MELLKKLTSIQAPSGSESNLKEFLLEYIKENKNHWRSQPQVFHGKDFQDCLLLVFGKPRTAVFAHMDTVGFSVKYGNELVKIGKPRAIDGTFLTGKDDKGFIRCRLKKINEEKKKEQKLTYQFSRELSRGTTLTFQPNFRETRNFVQSPYMDNRLGVWNALKIAETLEHGIIAFSCWEEHNGGAVGYLTRFIYEQFRVHQALISDVTWKTGGIRHGSGVAVSLRDSGIPRKTFLNKVLKKARESKVPFQLEVEDAGGSDGTEIQRSPYPVDWCFIGPPEDHVHSPDEKVHNDDIESMINMYRYLMKTL